MLHARRRAHQHAPRARFCGGVRAQSLEGSARGDAASPPRKRGGDGFFGSARRRLGLRRRRAQVRRVAGNLVHALLPVRPQTLKLAERPPAQLLARGVHLRHLALERGARRHLALQRHDKLLRHRAGHRVQHAGVLLGDVRARASRARARQERRPRVAARGRAAPRGPRGRGHRPRGGRRRRRKPRRCLRRRASKRFLGFLRAAEAHERHAQLEFVEPSVSQDDGETRPFRFARLRRDPRVQEPLLPGPEALAVETQAARALARRLQQPAVRASRAEPHEVPVRVHFQMQILVVP